MSRLAATVDTKSRELFIALGGAGGFAPGLPVLAGSEVEELFGSAAFVGRADEFSLFQSGSWLLGAATVPVDSGLEDVTRRLYETVLRATDGSHLARIWNYVPAINVTGTDGMENYRIFCRERSLAFERHFGPEFTTRLPAASAVGGRPGFLTLVFAASQGSLCHVENPLQVSAYDYPAAYGPRAPSFARATLVPAPEGTTIFIAGTAAIRGHATVAPLSTRKQLDCTLVNLGGIAQACGLGPDLDQNGTSTRHFKVYVRHAADQPLVAAILAERLLVATDRVIYVQADLCRAELLVEIEASLFGVTLLRPYRSDAAVHFQS